MNDTISDFLIRIKNAGLAGNKNVVLPYSKIKENLGKILKEKGYLEKLQIIEEEGRKQLVLTLSSEGGKVRRIEVKRISKSGCRVYMGAKDLKRLRGRGSSIVSTSAGLMTAKQAVKKNVGGEVICKVI